MSLRSKIAIAFIVTFLVGLCAGGGLIVFLLNKKIDGLAQSVSMRNVVYNTAMPLNIPATLPPSEFRTAAEKSVNAVVFVSTQTGGSSFFELESMLDMPMSGAGSGVIISADGYIITNNHVIDGADKVNITLNDKSEYPAEVVATDPNTDLAVLKIDAQNLQPITFANSDDTHIGQWVLAVGNPFSLTSTVTAGIISAKARNIGILRGNSSARSPVDYSIESFIQTDAAVNPGNSGGALVDMQGNLIGINTAIATETGSYSGYSFAIPSNLVNKVIKDLIAFGTVQRGFIGVNIQDINQKIASKNNLKTLKGALVTGLSESGAAKSAGIMEGDIITHVHGRRINSSNELQEQIANYKPGDVIVVSLLRNDKELKVSVTLRNAEGTTKAVKRVEPEKTNLSSLGASFTPAPETELKKRNIKSGVLVTRVMKNGKLGLVGIEENFIITKVDKREVSSVEDLQKAIDKGQELIYIEGYRKNGRKSYYAITK